MDKADNLKLGAIYKLAQTNELMRLIQILPCEGVWMEAAEGSDFARTFKFKDVLYASDSEVQDYIKDERDYNNRIFVKD